MNAEQLEKMLKLTREISELLKEDEQGSHRVAGSLSSLKIAILDELKNAVWARYLKEAQP